MKIDVVSIFPEYLRPLELSLIGRAQREGLVQIGAWDLRQWATDKHRSVDDTPFGGGAGMVMRPDVWGRCLDEIAGEGAVIAVPTPAGKPLAQADAQRLAQAEQIVIACGRYEGLDARITEHYAQRGYEIFEYSLGDVVLNGGEVAALALVEAVVRLLPGVVGNPHSLEEESHGGRGLLEYPNYTKPANWRGAEVDPVLLGGNHAEIEAWRIRRALEKTAKIRPDILQKIGPEGFSSTEKQWLVHAGYIFDGEALKRCEIRPATAGDAEAIAQLAGETFPLACPAYIPDEHVREFIEQNLSVEDFERALSQPQTHRVYAAWVDNEPIAYTLTIANPDKRDPLYRPSLQKTTGSRPLIELSKCYALKRYAGSGVSRALLEHTCERCGDDGFELMVLATYRGNERALNFYKKMGFKRAGKRVFHVADTPNDDYYLLRKLSGGSA